VYYVPVDSGFTMANLDSQSDPMKFLKLLDPRDGDGQDISFVGRQQQEANGKFPELVSASRLNYWSPKDSVLSQGIRYLVGLAATYDLRDLRLADILNEQLGASECMCVRVDVFNTADIANMDKIDLYYSPVPLITPGWHFSPIVGKWVDGKQVHAISGYEARKYILEELGCTITVDEATANLSPPDPNLLEG